MTQLPKTPAEQDHNSRMNQPGEDYAAAAIDRVIDDATRLPPLPPALAAKIIADGEAMLGNPALPQPKPESREPRRWWWMSPAPAWGAACASLVLALSVFWSTPKSVPSLSPSDLDQKLAQMPAAARLNWEGMGDPTYANVSGYVRWDNRTQRGVMQLIGLPVNNPTEAQYQLWIVDPQRDANPIDGGVFNISAGDNLVAIDAKLQVINPKAFAITLEQPGGVVVSAGPLLVIASS
ncbi:MAG: anti-sigma factor [Lysobacterales bacterium]